MCKKDRLLGLLAGIAAIALVAVPCQSAILASYEGTSDTNLQNPTAQGWSVAYPTAGVARQQDPTANAWQLIDDTGLKYGGYEKNFGVTDVAFLAATVRLNDNANANSYANWENQLDLWTSASGAKREYNFAMYNANNGQDVVLKEFSSGSAYTFVGGASNFQSFEARWRGAADPNYFDVYIKDSSDNFVFAFATAGTDRGAGDYNYLYLGDGAYSAGKLSNASYAEISVADAVPEPASLGIVTLIGGALLSVRQRRASVKG